MQFRLYELYAHYALLSHKRDHEDHYAGTCINGSRKERGEKYANRWVLTQSDPEVDEASIYDLLDALNRSEGSESFLRLWGGANARQEFLELVWEFVRTYNKTLRLGTPTPRARVELKRWWNYGRYPQEGSCRGGFNEMGQGLSAPRGSSSLPCGGAELPRGCGVQ